MTDVIYCLVDSKGDVYTRDGAESYADVAMIHGLDAEKCSEYRYDVVRRQLVEDRGTPFGSVAARGYFSRQLGTAARFMRFAAEGHVPHEVLLKVLDSSIRRPYLDTCASIERKYTTDCASSGDPCLESGCSADGERCLQPLLRAGIDYYKACGAEWAKLFADSANRDGSWKATFAHYDV